MKKLSVVVALFWIVGCGGEGGSTAPAPIVTAPTITSSNTMIYIGQSVQFAATGGGTIRWGGDSPSVATVDQTTGRVTGVATGRVTIWVENEGGRTTRLLRGLPSYAGGWRGNYTIQDCQSNGAFAIIAFCSSNFRLGQSLSMTLAISQAEDRITSGSVGLGSLTGSLTTTTVGEDGQARLAGTMTPLPGNSIRVGIENMRLESPNAGVIHGQYEQVWSDTSLSGTARVYARIETLTRESGGPTFGFTAPASGSFTLEDIVRMVKGDR
jgi:hypothetical protein